MHLALRQKIKPGWHTYWRNPGDSGEPTRLAWVLPEGWSAGEIIWPVPERQPIGPLVDYGYSNARQEGSPALSNLGSSGVDS